MACSSDKIVFWVFQLQTFRFIPDISGNRWAVSLGRFWGCAPSVHLATVLPWCLLKVRLCSPLQLGNTLLVGASLDYPQFLRLALPKTLHARISWVSSLYIFLWHLSDIDYVQNCSKKYRCLKKLLRLLLGGVGWGLGTLFAGQGDSLLCWLVARSISSPASTHTAGVVAITEEQRSHSRRDHTGAKRRRTAQLFALLTPAKVL